MLQLDVQLFDLLCHTTFCPIGFDFSGVLLLVLTSVIASWRHFATVLALNSIANDSKETCVSPVA